MIDRLNYVEYVELGYFFRHIYFRIRVTAENAEYKTQPWPGMGKEFAAWLDFLDYQVCVDNCC